MHCQEQEGRGKQSAKIAIVLAPDTRVEPRAVVVKFLYAAVADWAMNCSVASLASNPRRPIDITRRAELQFNQMCATTDHVILKVLIIV